MANRKLLYNVVERAKALQTSNIRELMFKIRHGDLTGLKSILNSKISSNVLDVNGNSPLITALNFKRTNIIKCLLDAGANPNELSRGSIVVKATRDALLNVSATPLIYALGFTNPDLSAIRLLLTAGADPNKRVKYNDFDDNTNDSSYAPVHFSIRHELYDKDLRLLKLLVTHGANINAATKKGRTLSHALVDYGPVPITSLVRLLPNLVKLGLDLNARNNPGNTFLHELVGHPAQTCGDSEYPKLIQVMSTAIDLGADPAIKNKKGHDVLQFLESIDASEFYDKAKFAALLNGCINLAKARKVNLVSPSSDQSAIDTDIQFG